MEEGMKKPRILYVHGFATSGLSKTATVLKEEFGDLVLTPDFQIHKLRDALKMAETIVAENPSIDIVVGTSMGGTVAIGMPSLRRVLVNPVTRPYTVMNQYLLGKPRTVYLYRVKRQSEEQGFILTKDDVDKAYVVENIVRMKPETHGLGKNRNCIAFIGEDDTVFTSGYEDLREFGVFDGDIHILKGEGHALTRKAIREEVVPTIRKLLEVGK